MKCEKKKRLSPAYMQCIVMTRHYLVLHGVSYMVNIMLLAATVNSESRLCFWHKKYKKFNCFSGQLKSIFCANPSEIYFESKVSRRRECQIVFD